MRGFRLGLSSRRSAISSRAFAIDSCQELLRPAGWRYPDGAARFLLANHIGGPMFNTYEYGGYLMWRLWPQERVFIDGRALNVNEARPKTERSFGGGGGGGRGRGEKRW